VLAFPGRTTFTYGDVVQGRSGECRLHPQLARTVGAVCRMDSEQVKAGVAQLRSLLTTDSLCVP
jgi:hypothetical protein